MGSTAFGNFNEFCHDSTLPVCNLFATSTLNDGAGFGGCELLGIELSNGRFLRNLGSILLAFIAILLSVGLIYRSELKKAAVGRREMQLFLLGFIIVEICEIFTVGGIPLPPNVVLGFTAVHLAAITATLWILMLNAFVGYQLLDDGTVVSIAAILVSAAILFVGTGYIALDTGFNFTNYFNSDANSELNRSIGLYVLYQLIPLICVVVFFVLEAILVLRVLGEKKPMLYLCAAALLFAIGQVFNYAISRFICEGTSGRIDGALFQTLFTLLSVAMVWVFWSSITEDDWPNPEPRGAETSLEPRY